jgi:glycosyltransferase involved in cell wall biosynthesis
MKQQKPPKIKLVFTSALKKEVPKDWLRSHQVPVYTLKALKSGTIWDQRRQHQGILILITGAGLQASTEAACWIRDNISPLFVVNIGTCGLTKRSHQLGEWLIPHYSANEKGEKIELDIRLPIPYPGKVRFIHSLLSVRKTHLGMFPESWKQYDAVDMECYEQARILSDAQIYFHCLKFSTDYSDANAPADFQKNLGLYTENMKKLLSFIPAGREPKKISVVVPVFNRQYSIKRAVESILSQSYSAEEIIVVDDSSSDKTRETLKQYDNKITCLSLPVTSGVSRARNTGIQYAQSEWVSFLDSDDCWTGDKLAQQVEYLKKYPFYEIIQSEEIWIRNGRRINPCKHHKKPVGWIWEQSLQRCLVSPSSVLMKKSLLNQYGNFDENLPVCEDYALWLKISRHHPVGLDTRMSVIKYGGHSDQLSRQYPAMDRFRVKSLTGLLKNEQIPHFRQKIVAVLTKKLNILIQGYEKRQRAKEAEELKSILKSLV